MSALLQFRLCFCLDVVDDEWVGVYNTANHEHVQI